MKSFFAILATALLLAPLHAHGDGRIKLDSTTTYDAIIMMNPANVDPSGLKLTSVQSFHSTGTPQDVDVATWRLTLDGRVDNPLSLTYTDLTAMPTVTKRAIVICPGYFFDYAEWEGVPLKALLEKAGAQKDFSRISFTSVDGYTSTFLREEVDSHLMILATKANGEPLPRQHGFPLRLVVEDVYGGRWVKYLREIRVE